jgi:hypothetical protein
MSVVLPAKTAVRLGERTLDLLVTVHRWLGTALCLVFAAWFSSGIVMMYAGYPLLSEADKLVREPSLNLTAARLTPGDAYRRAGLDARVDHVRLGTMLERPTYFFMTTDGWVAVGADDGAVRPAVDAEAAVRIAREFEVGAGAPHYVGLFDSPDQWTIYTRWAPYLPSHDFAPFHRLAFDDGTELSVLAATGDVVQRTTPSERLWGYLGPYVHWIYPTTFRTRHADAWNDLIVWLSALGTAICLSGVVIGIYFFRWRREPGVAGSPYRGWLKWHHWIGLVFGVLAGTWVFSGLMSMDPWSWSTTEARVERMSGGPLALDAFVAPPAVAASACRSQLNVKEIRLVQLKGAPYYYCFQTPHLSLLVAADGSGGEVLARFPESELVEAARSVLPSAQVASAELLEDYDSYYYPGWEDKLENDTARRLPVLKIAFDDVERTLVYVDPHTGEAVGAYDTSGRSLRWLYHGLHSLDFAGFYAARPLWDLIVLPFMLGGAAMSVTGTWIGYRWLKRKVRKPGRRSAAR